MLLGSDLLYDSMAARVLSFEETLRVALSDAFDRERETERQSARERARGARLMTYFVGAGSTTSSSSNACDHVVLARGNEQDGHKLLCHDCGRARSLG